MVARRGQALGLIKASAAIIEGDQVGKRSPNINRQKNHDLLPLLTWLGATLNYRVAVMGRREYRGYRRMTQSPFPIA
jgi:hypothetical protein